METWNFIDKTKWIERGPWDTEPDKAQWQDPATGLVCLMVRNAHLGHWCGYVGVGEQHPAFGKHYYNDAPDTTLDDIRVHGGLTFADRCQPVYNTEEPEFRVCHTPAPGESDNIWWLGFDCGHAGDRSMMAMERDLQETIPLIMSYQHRETYRDFGYVQEQCTELAAQLQEMAGNGQNRV